MPPRAVTAENHDRAYTKILDTIEIIEQEHLYDRIRIYMRGENEHLPKLIFDSNEDSREKSIRQLIIDARKQNEIELLKNRKEFLRRIKDLNERAIQSGIPEQVRKLKY